ncbi:MAG: hypothetical protein M0P31_01675 [Solirubrobacteraceae bacterium]|nr:hypothetical protein [Solirubrobacteraceae bacterium]
MDVPLEELAAVSEAVGRAEAAAADGGWHGARAALDDADGALEVLRERYRDLDDRSRATVARLAGPLRARRDAVAAAIPRPRAVSDAAPVHDPEQDESPDPDGDPVA